jgi:hypothetical protein
MIGQFRTKRPFNQRFLQPPEQPVVARQVLGPLVARKQLIQKFRCQCRGRHVSSFQKVNSQKPAYTRLLTLSRHRLRAVQLKQWKRGTTMYRELLALGAKPDVAHKVAANNRRWWRNSGMLLNSVLTLNWFDRLGLPRLS